MSQRKGFVMLAQAEQISISEVCRRFGISRVTGYKWLDRYHELGDGRLADMSRRPHHAPASFAFAHGKGGGEGRLGGQRRSSRLGSS